MNSGGAMCWMRWGGRGGQRCGWRCRNARRRMMMMIDLGIEVGVGVVPMPIPTSTGAARARHHLNPRKAPLQNLKRYGLGSRWMRRRRRNREVCWRGWRCRVGMILREVRRGMRRGMEIEIGRAVGVGVGWRRMEGVGLIRARRGIEIGRGRIRVGIGIGIRVIRGGMGVEVK
ncbi:hypothetical protein BJ165DRAFT_122212 [Panaeolus papilionaceus]|nr:hypothetical protein BJ165DRAFT_122212 [Panaeolus papilionaceus]